MGGGWLLNPKDDRQSIQN